MSSDGHGFGWTGLAWVPIKVNAFGKMVTNAIAGGVTNWLQSQRPAIRLTAVANFGILARPIAGISAAITALTFRLTQTPATVIVTSVIGTLANVVDTPALNMVQAKYDLVRLNPGQATGFSSILSDWVGLSNANGDPNGTFATLTEGALTAAGVLNGTFAPSVGKDELTITKVELLAYFKITGSAATTLCSIKARHGTGTAVTVATHNGADVDFVASPEIIDITATLFTPGIGQPALTWPNVDDLHFEVDGTIPVSPTSTPVISVDAYKLRVTASKTDVL